MTISQFRPAAIERRVLDAFDASGLDWPAFVDAYEVMHFPDGDVRVQKKPTEAGQKATEEIKAEFAKSGEKIGAKP